MHHEHELITIAYCNDGEFLVGKALEVNGAIGMGRSEDELIKDIRNAVKAIREATKIVSEGSMEHFPSFNSIKTIREVPVCA